MKTLLATMVLLASVNSFAIIAHNNGPQIEPGPELQLDDSSAEAIDTLLLAKSTHLSQFKKSGNVTQSITRQNLEPGKTTFVFVRQQCSTGGFVGHLCLGGARLVVNVEQVQMGSLTKTSATSSISFLK